MWMKSVHLQLKVISFCSCEISIFLRLSTDSWSHPSGGSFYQLWRCHTLLAKFHQPCVCVCVLCGCIYIVPNMTLKWRTMTDGSSVSFNYAVSRLVIKGSRTISQENLQAGTHRLIPRTIPRCAAPYLLHQGQEGKNHERAPWENTSG